jgi:hypothetical protein
MGQPNVGIGLKNAPAPTATDVRACGLYTWAEGANGRPWRQTGYLKFLWDRWKTIAAPSNVRIHNTAQADGFVDRLAHLAAAFPHMAHGEINPRRALNKCRISSNKH